VIAPNEAEQFVEVHGGVIPVKHPQEDSLYSRKLQAIENLVDHVKGNALPPEFWNNPNIFEEALMIRSAAFTGNTSDANLCIG
jgi:hypothetical protein